MSVNYIVSPDPREMFPKFSSFLCRLSFNWKLQLPMGTGRNCRSQFQVSQIWSPDHKLNRALHKYLINSNYTGVVAMSSRKEHCQSDRECPFRVIVASRNVNGGRCWWNIANSHQIDCVEGPLNWPNNLVIELFRTNCVWILHGEGQNMCNRDGGGESGRVRTSNSENVEGATTAGCPIWGDELNFK